MKELKRFPVSDKLLSKFGQPLDIVQTEPLPIWATGNIFRVDEAYYAPSADGNGHLTLVVHNTSGQWVAVNIDRSGGVSDTGHIAKDQDGGFTEVTQLYVQRDNKVTRWRPGVFGIPGNGGGELHFDVPADTLDVYLEITVVG